MVEAIGILRRTDVTVRMSNGVERSVQLLGPTDIERKGPGIATTLTYELHPKLLPILRDSQIFARFEMQILQGIGTKYGMALYEMVVKRSRLTHVFYEDFSTDDLRDFLGVPSGKLGPFGDFLRKAIEPAVAEVNTLAPFSCCIDVMETQGRKVTQLRLSWWMKSIEERRAQWEVKRKGQPDLFEAEEDPDLQIWGSAAED